MFNWLRRLWQSINPEKQQHNVAPMGKAGVVPSAGAKAHQETQPGPVHPKAQDPVIVRGKYYKSTEEIRWQLAPEPEKNREGSVEDLIKQLGRVDRSEIRRCAAEKLGQMGLAAVPAISNLLTTAVDVDADVRKAALDALNSIDPGWQKNEEARKAFPHLVAALKSWSPDVSKAAFRLLNQIGAPAVPDLVNALSKEEDTADKVYIIQILRWIGPEAASAVPGLIKALSSQIVQERITAAEALAQMGLAAEPAVPALAAGLVDKFADCRLAMVGCLAHLGPIAEPAVPVILPLLADREERVRIAASAALEKIGPNTVPALIKIVQVRDVQRLKAGFESIIKNSPWYTRPLPNVLARGDYEAWRNLSWAVYDINLELTSLEAAQEAALRILGKFGPAASEAVPSITQALADRNPGIQLVAIQVLGQIGPVAKAAVPELTRALKDERPRIREEAARTLVKINNQAECEIVKLLKAGKNQN